MATFSWSDSVYAAFAPCLSCLRARHVPSDEDHGPHFIPRARPDELEGLLADTDDAETLSLHSSLGDRNGRRRKRLTEPSHKGVKLFGFYLFGRPPIHLPDDEESTENGARHSARRIERARTISASTLDSDASPLDPSTIDELTAARVAERIAQQREAERLAKGERRRQRRERKEAKRAALALALHADEGEEFEGFQGSGPSPALTQSGGSDNYSSVTEEFGPYQNGHDSEEPDGGDFDAVHYVRRASVSGGTGSDHSRTSASRSSSSPDPTQYNHHYISQQPLPHPQAEQQRSGRHHKKRPSSGHMGRRPSLTSRSSTSQSASVPSPTVQQTSFPAIAEHDVSQGVSAYATPDDLSAVSVNMGFPSAGLRGAPPSRKNSQTSGVFLARRGDD